VLTLDHLPDSLLDELASGARPPAVFAKTNWS
jgi:hypothetical protein